MCALAAARYSVFKILIIKQVVPVKSSYSQSDIY